MTRNQEPAELRPARKSQFGTWDGLASFQAAISNLPQPDLAPTRRRTFDLSDVGSRFEINKGWHTHEFDPDRQAEMMAGPGRIAVASIRVARLSRGWTQGKLAKLARVSTSAISIAERMTIGVSVEARARICAALGIATVEALAAKAAEVRS